MNKKYNRTQATFIGIITGLSVVFISDYLIPEISYKTIFIILIAVITAYATSSLSKKVIKEKRS